MALSKIIAEGVDLTDTFAFTGTVTGAGEITASTTAPSEGGAATTNVVQGLAKSWVNFNADGTIATRDSLNIASMTDSATGVFSMNLSNAMGNDDYAMSGCAFHSSAGGFDDSVVLSRDSTQTSSVSTTVNPFYTYRLTTTQIIQDCIENMVILHGDLA